MTKNPIDGMPTNYALVTIGDMELMVEIPAGGEVIRVSHYRHEETNGERGIMRVKNYQMNLRIKGVQLIAV